jgi:hypothetical protein
VGHVGASIAGRPRWGGTTHVGAGPGSTACATTRRWDWRVVAMCLFQIGLFKFKFNRLN